MEIISFSSGRAQESQHIGWLRGIMYSLLFIAVSEKEDTVQFSEAHWLNTISCQKCYEP